MRVRLGRLTTGAYAAVRRLFWWLPAPLRHRLHGVRHAFVRTARPTVGRAAAGRPGDVDWATFLVQAGVPSRERLTIVFEPNLDWEIPLRQRPQHLARALAAEGHLVLYRTLGDELSGCRQVTPDLWLVNADEVETLTGVWRVFYSTSLYATAADLARAGRAGRVAYEYVDHLDAMISGGASALARLESLRDAAWAGGADLVVSSARALHAEAVAHRGAPNCILVPNGVDVAHYRVASPPRLTVPDSLAAFRAAHRHVVGYFGAIAPWLWFDAIAGVAAARPEVGFVFIGPDYGGSLGHLPRRSNVIHAGAAPYETLPALAATFDAAWIPFLPGPLARATSPLKLFEYFALGLPVAVSADMAECIGFEGVTPGEDVPGLTRAVDAALSQARDADVRERLRGLAAQHDWRERARAYGHAMMALTRH